jgi:hypothetical protein
MWHDKKPSSSIKGRGKLGWPSDHLLLKQGSVLMETAWLPSEKHNWKIFDWYSHIDSRNK